MFRWMLLALWALVACGSSTNEDPPQKGAKNVILIIADTLRADHLDAYGYRRPTSPNLTSFAKEGVLFERAYAHAPWTKPSIATILTSRVPRDHGVTQWEAVLSPEQQTFAEYLKSQGFSTTAYISHHALMPKNSRFEQGFDTYDTTVVKKGDPHKVLSSEDITDLGLAFLKEPPDSRWMLMLHYFDPHVDYRKHAQWDFGDRDVDRYDSEIAYLDDHLGRLFTELEKSGRLEDTVVAFVADHGDEFRDHGDTQHTVQLWEEVIHVPWIMRGPGIEPQRVGVPVGLVDVVPTLVELMGLPQSPEFGGRPLPLEKGRFAPDPKAPVIAETRRIKNRRAVMKGRYKLIVDLREHTAQLYDIETDPGEKKDIASEKPGIVADLRADLDAHYATADATAPKVELDDETRLALEQLGYLTEGEGSKVHVDWVALEGGTYAMGDNRDPKHRDAQPVHDVTVPDFEIMRNELTVGQYRACVTDGACVMPANTCTVDLDALDAPMLCLTYREAIVACQWVGGRLPSESEWEFAARSRGKDTLYPWGDEPADCSRTSGPIGPRCSAKPHAVCSKPSGNTEQGVCDMAGNAVEWVFDTYTAGYTGAPLNGKPRIDNGAPQRVLRGGGMYTKVPVTNRARQHRGVDYNRQGAGVRCVR
ncbi:MAG: sulfatase-like hydrolase/transferase [Alphaproteobacteria bacterium]|nr:sulfatase-like hydrolase/transferase [Alphaproteobacteria bacterium]